MTTIALADIVPAPWNARGEITPESVAELAESIKTQGLINPITVWKSEVGNWVCVAGNRRLSAMIALGWDHCDCCVYDGDEAGARLVTVTENLQREDIGVIEEAALVETCLDGGMTANEVAAKTGRSVAWVNRRKKLGNLTENWRERADKMTADALEHIACYPPEVQDSAYRSAPGTATDWLNLRYWFDRESKDLALAKFDAKTCRECLKRTGVEADLFGEVDGALGRCLDGKCWRAKLDAWIDGRIAELVGGAKFKRVPSWDMPDGSEKRTKKNCFAYVNVDEYNNCEIKVVWAEPPEVIAKRIAEIEAAQDAEREKNNAKFARIRAVEDKLSSAFNAAQDDETDLRNFANEVIMDGDEAAFVEEAVIESLCGYRYGSEWARFLRAHKGAAKFAGICDADLKEFLNHYPEKDDNEDDED